MKSFWVRAAMMDRSFVRSFVRLLGGGKKGGRPPPPFSSFSSFSSSFPMIYTLTLFF